MERREILKSGIAALIGFPVASELVVKGQVGFAGKYVPRQITAMHPFGPYLQIKNMETGEMIDGCLAADIDRGLIRCFDLVGKEAKEREIAESSSDLFGDRTPRPVNNKIYHVQTHDDALLYDEAGRYSLDWKEDGKLPLYWEKIRHADPEYFESLTSWRGKCPSPCNSSYGDLVSFFK